MVSGVRMFERLDGAAQFNSTLGIHCKYGGGRASDIRETEDFSRRKLLEVFAPDIPSWMKEPRQFPCEWIDPRQVGPLVKVASSTGERRIVEVVITAM
jgi:hypothetical protein